MQGNPGWYPDPYGRADQRYFDGSQWQAQVATGGQPWQDPPPGAGVGQPGGQAGGQAGWGQPPGHPGAQPGGQAGWGQAGGQPGGHPGWGQPGGQAGWGQPPAPAKRGWVVPVAVLSAFVLIAGAVVGAVLLLRTGTATPPDRPMAAGPTARATTNDDVSVATPGGARLDIPAGAVPAAASGQPGAMDVTIREAPDAPAPAPGSLPEGLRVDTAAALSFEPSGQTFSQPVTVSVPLPAGTDPDTVGGLARYEPATGAWQPVASYLDAATGELRAELMRFSTYAPWYDRPQRNTWREQNGGWIVVTNVLVGSEGWPGFPSSFFGSPAPRHGQTSTSYGVAINAYTLANPGLAHEVDWYVRDDYPLTVWARPGTSGVAAATGGTREFWLPAGTYTLAETWSGSEINVGRSPLYVPLYGSAYRPLGELTIEPGGRYAYVEEERLGGQLREEDGWIRGRVPAFGQELPAPMEAETDADPTDSTGDRTDTDGTDTDGTETGGQDPEPPPPISQPDTPAFCAAVEALDRAEIALDDPAIEGNAAAVDRAFSELVSLFEEVARTAPPDLVADARLLADTFSGLQAEIDRQNAWGQPFSELDRITDAYADRLDEDRLDRAFDNLFDQAFTLCDL